MKKVIIMLMIATLPAISHAQMKNLMNKVGNKIKSKAASRADRKIDNEIDRGLDVVEGKNQPAKQATSSATPTGGPSSKGNKMYLKYDFVPGEQIIYSNDFATDNMGELPTGWNSNGSGAVVTMENVKGTWVQLNQNAAYLTDNAASFTENFTVEFDLILRRTNAIAPFPEFTWGVLSSGALTPGHNDLLKNYMGTFATEMNLQPADKGNSSVYLKTYNNSAVYLRTDIKKPVDVLQQFNNIIHVAMQVQKERLRIWFNDEKFYDLPKAITPGADINQLYFNVKRYGGADNEVGYTISNIKIAKGLPDTRHKLMEEGRFSTTGILFDVNSYQIKPESAGVINEIAGVLTKNPDLKIKIIGHTDSDGNDKANLELSNKRAAAIRQMLISDFKIDAARMESEGAGESQPVSDNNSKEGKANNRRVEFIKL